MYSAVQRHKPTASLFKCIFVQFCSSQQDFNLKGDMQRFFTELAKKYFRAAYCNINPSV